MLSPLPREQMPPGCGEAEAALEGSEGEDEPGGRCGQEGWGLCVSAPRVPLPQPTLLQRETVTAELTRLETVRPTSPG